MKDCFGIIYRFIYLPDNRKYYGQTVASLSRRKNTHLSFARNKKFSNTYFHNFLRKHLHEKDLFLWEEVEKCYSREELDEREKYWIAIDNTTNKQFGFNILEGGHVNIMENEEVKKKIIIALNKPEVIKKRVESYKNTISQEGFKENFRKIIIEAMNRPEVKEKLKIAGAKRSNNEELKELISEKTKEAMNRPDIKEKHKKALNTPEELERKANASKKRFENIEERERQSKQSKKFFSNKENKEKHKKALNDPTLKIHLSRVRRKLTDEQVFEIKKLLDNGEEVAYLAKEYNVSKETIRRIKRGKYAPESLLKL